MEETHKIDELESTIPVEPSDNGGRVYELAYIFVPTLSEEELAKSFTDLKGLLGTKEVTFISEEAPKHMELAYEMNRTIQNKKTWFTEGYFGWIKFEADAKVIKDIHETLARDESIIRFMIIKTVRENTIFSKRTYTRGRRDMSKGDEGQADAPKEAISEKEVDAEIDAMIGA